MHIDRSLALRLYSDVDLGSGDYNIDQVPIANALPIPIKNGSQSQADLRRKLQADINEFIDLIPTDEVASKMVEFYRNDYDVHRVFDYLNGEEFAMLEHHLVGSKEYLEVDAMLGDLGVNIKSIRERLNRLLGFSELRTSLKDGTSLKSETTEACKFY